MSAIAEPSQAILARMFSHVLDGRDITLTRCENNQVMWTVQIPFGTHQFIGYYDDEILEGFEELDRILRTQA